MPQDPAYGPTGTPPPDTSATSTAATGSTSWASGPSETGATDTDGEADGTTLPKFDVAPETDPADGQAPCPGIDVLFVVDDSHSMSDEQSHLVDSFPGFSDGLLTLVGAGYDVHVGVVTTDAYAFNEEGCTEIGALTTKTGGNDASNAMCAPFSLGRFMSKYDDLEADFACAARVGTSGDPKERPMLAALEALSPDKLAPSGCNAGFRRDEALLVIVIVTDEEDLQDSPGMVEDWYEGIVERAGGDPDHVVVLSLVGTPKPNACPDFQWNGSEGAEVAHQIIAFTEMFGPRGLVGDVCASDYAPFFAEAVELVSDACAALPAAG